MRVTQKIHFGTNIERENTANPTSWGKREVGAYGPEVGQMFYPGIIWKGIDDKIQCGIMKSFNFHMPPSPVLHSIFHFLFY